MIHAKVASPESIVKTYVHMAALAKNVTRAASAPGVVLEIDTLDQIVMISAQSVMYAIKMARV